MKAVVALKLNGQIPRHCNNERKISTEYNNITAYILEVVCHCTCVYMDTHINFIQIDLFNELYPLFLHKISTFVTDA